MTFFHCFAFWLGIPTTERSESLYVEPCQVSIQEHLRMGRTHGHPVFVKPGSVLPFAYSTMVKYYTEQWTDHVFGVVYERTWSVTPWRRIWSASDARKYWYVKRVWKVLRRLNMAFWNQSSSLKYSKCCSPKKFVRKLAEALPKSDALATSDP